MHTALEPLLKAFMWILVLCILVRIIGYIYGINFLVALLRNHIRRKNMPTTVVNLYKEEYDVYIGRPGKGQSGEWGNPIARGNRCFVCHAVHTEPGSTLECYRHYLRQRMQEPSFVARMRSLKGKRLGCFCKPKPCHGDILAEEIDKL